jgi:diguanylate cyclase (GGDEF)-like protein
MSNQGETIQEIIEKRKSAESENARLKAVINRLSGAVSAWKTTARRDGLTGLVRREAFEDVARTLITRSQKNGVPVSYVLIDIDHFKKVNDNYGHQRGDEVLTEVGTIMTQEARRPMDIAGRIGGEELAIFLSNTDNKGAGVVAERLRSAIETYFSERDPSITVSAGVATYIPGSETLDPLEAYTELYGTADRKLYEAKGSGRNKVVL